ncbi:MAG TPA: Ig-like domain-containing protein [Marmoricola sp.]
MSKLTSVRAALLGILALVAATLVLPMTMASAVSSDGSIVFIRNNQVWISDGHGAHARKLTTQGTTAKPFRYPSEDDHGHIVAMRGNGFVVLDQVGHVLHSYAQPLVNTGTLEYASVSPDGSKVAFTMLAMSNICDPYCGFESVHSMYYMGTASGRILGGMHTAADVNTGSWVTNSRTVLGSTVTKLYYQDPASAGEKSWFQDCDDVMSNCPDSNESNYWNVFPTVNRAGNRYASVVVDEAYGGGNDRSTFLNVRDTASFKTGKPPARPTGRCIINGNDTMSSDGFPGISQASINTPSWGPDGRSLVVSFKNAAGRWQVWRIDTGRDVTDCSAYDGDAILDNADQPRWSPAPLGAAKLPTRTTLSVSKHKVKRHRAITLTAHVRPVVASGKVAFFDGAHRLKAVALKRGVAKLKVKLNKLGKHRLRVVYAGDSRDGGSHSGTVTVTVKR